MNVEPVINVRFKKFREIFDLQNVPDGTAFERFVNHAILTSHQPDAFSADDELLDTVCVGGFNDLGVDGIAIKLNGLLIQDIDDIKDILEKFKRANVEFIFIQSKYKPKFEMGEFNNFIAGVRDFLSESHLQPMNEKVQVLLKLKDYLLSDDVVIMWENNPSVRLYYVAMGRWRDSPHHIGLAEQFKSDIKDLNAYGDCDVQFVDSESLKVICDSNENAFSSTINSIDTMPLSAVKGVENSCIALCYATELLGLLTNEDGIIRKSLFDDNVRDYQGDNSVNLEIENTIAEDPEMFILLNNGITIVCDEFLQNNRRITLKNPQIVNGCQTSHVVFFANKKGYDIKNVPISVKIISTKDSEITNQIVRGTNRQNIVYDEAFEATKKFHKDLEEFFNAICNDYDKIYYERRSKQYHYNPRIKQIQKINLKVLTQYFVGMFLNAPHMSHRHESKLLKEYANTIYQEHQSKLPYFTAALSFYHLEALFRKETLSKVDLYSFRSHLLMIFRELVSGNCPSLNSEKSIDSHCAPILAILKSATDTEKHFKEAIGIFYRSKEKWISELKKSASGMKDILDFTKLLLSETSVKKAGDSNTVNKPTETGKVVKILNDRYGSPCGFIKREPYDIFFHSKINPELDFAGLIGRVVSYSIGKSERTGNLIATNVSLVND